MKLEGKSLGLLVASKPNTPSFRHAIKLAERALARGVKVYFYCLDQAIEGLLDVQLQALKRDGVKLFACAFGAHRRQIPMSDQATFSGLGVMSDVISRTDRFVAFT